VVADVFTYHFIRPDGRLGLELGAVPDLQRAGAAAGEEVGDLLPGEVLGLLELDEQGVVLGRELELGALGPLRRVRHARLADDAGRAVVLGRAGRRLGEGAAHARGLGRRGLVGQAVPVELLVGEGRGLEGLVGALRGGDGVALGGEEERAGVGLQLGVVSVRRQLQRGRDHVGSGVRL